MLSMRRTTRAPRDLQVLLRERLDAIPRGYAASAPTWKTAALPRQTPPQRRCELDGAPCAAARNLSRRNRPEHSRNAGEVPHGHRGREGAGWLVKRSRRGPPMNQGFMPKIRPHHRLRLFGLTVAVHLHVAVIDSGMRGNASGSASRTLSLNSSVGSGIPWITYCAGSVGPETLRRH